MELFLRKRTNAPLLLSHVCGRWRAVSVSTPALWSTFSTVGLEDDRKKHVEALKVWISRSRTLPLTIHVGNDFELERSSPDSLQLLELLASEASRWMDITVLGVPDNLKGVLLAPFQNPNLPHLESFHVEPCMVIKPGRHVRTNGYSFNLASIPRLRRFTHDGELIHIEFRREISRIRTLEITDSWRFGWRYSHVELLTCLTYCPLLVELTLSVEENSPNAPNHRQIPIIVLAHLEMFNLTIGAHTDPGYLISQLSLPKLTDLNICMEDQIDDHDPLAGWQHLQPLLSRPHLLQKLWLHAAMTEADLIACLQVTPFLDTLHFTGKGCTDALLEFLTIDDSDPSGNFCPRLTFLWLGGHHTTFSPQSMIEMILSRRRGAGYQGGSNATLEQLGCDSFDFRSILSNPDIATCVEDAHSNRITLRPYNLR